MVTFHSTIHDGSISLFRNALFSNLRVDPIWESPCFRVDKSKLYGSACIILDGLLEGFVELFIVQEYIWVVIPSVEMSLDGFD